MTEKEYIEFLEAVAGEYISLDHGHPHWGPEGPSYLLDHIDELTSLARFVKIAEERTGNELLLKALGSDLEHVGFRLQSVVNALDETGINEALDAYGETILANFRGSVVPEEDLNILRRAGIEHPEAVMRLVEVRAEYFSKLAATRDFRPSSVIKTAKSELETASKQLQAEASNNEKKPRKWFKGISKVLAGGAGALGNVLLGVGAIPVATPIGAAAVLSSCTGAIVLIGDGLEAIRGND